MINTIPIVILGALLINTATSQLGEITPSKEVGEQDSTTNVNDSEETPEGITNSNPDFTSDSNSISDSDSNSKSVISVKKSILVQDTYIGCANGTKEFANSLVYFNIAQVLDSNYSNKYEDSDPGVCFHFCKTSSPSLFISVQEAFFNNTQSCGCHGNLLDDWQDEDLCDFTPGFLRLYCGPTNFDCFNHSQNLNLNLLLIIFIITSLLIVK